jgi:hypothetical protein
MKRRVVKQTWRERMERERERRVQKQTRRERKRKEKEKKREENELLRVGERVECESGKRV